MKRKIRFPVFSEVDGDVVVGDAPSEPPAVIAENNVCLLVQDDAGRQLKSPNMDRREARRLKGAPGVTAWLRALLRDAPDVLRKLPRPYRMLAANLEPLSAEAVAHPSVASRVAAA